VDPLKQDHMTVLWLILELNFNIL